MNPDRPRWAARVALCLALGGLTGCGGCEDKPAGSEPIKLNGYNGGAMPRYQRRVAGYQPGARLGRLLRGASQDAGVGPEDSAIPNAGGPDR